MVSDDIGNRHLAWITIWAFIGLVVLGIGVALTDLAAKPQWWWVWFLVGFCGLVLLFSVWAAISPYVKKWPFPDYPKKESQRKSKIYRDLQREGDVCLKGLEQASKMASTKGAPLVMLPDLHRSVSNHVTKCQTWIAKSTREVAHVSEKFDADAFATKAPSRSKPAFIKNPAESSIWLQTAGRLDWLRDQLAE